MEQAEIDKLVELASDVDGTALKALHTAWQEAFDGYRDNSNKSTLAEWQAQEKALRAKVDELTARYVGSAEVKTLSNLIETWKYLQSEGYKVGRQSVYNARDKGLLAVQADGTVTEPDALAYAAKHLKKIKAKSDKPDKLYEERASEDLALLKVKRSRAQFDFDKERGKYILKSDARTEIAIKIAAFEAGIKHLFRTFLPDWLMKSGGKADKAPMVLELVNAEVDSLLNEFGRMTDIGVVIVKSALDDTDVTVDDDQEGGIFEIAESSGNETIEREGDMDLQA